MVHRLINTPLSEENYKKELDYIKSVATYNGFKPSLIDNIVRKTKKKKNKNSRTTLNAIKTNDETTWTSVTYQKGLSKSISKTFKNNSNIKIAFKCKHKLKNKLQNPKDPIKEEDKSGIYKINCDVCDGEYIGQTLRKLKTRFNEHFSHIKFDREEKSAVAKHCLNSGHSIPLQNTKLIKSVSSTKELNAGEPYFINKSEKLLNNDPGPIQNSCLLQKSFIRKLPH